MLIMLQKMISNSVWMVTKRVNSRVTKFVRNKKESIERYIEIVE